MREDGAILIDGVQQGTTQRCPHCQGHFILAKSGTLEMAKQSALSDMARPRVFCKRCNRLTCGRQCCDPALYCVPFEAKLERSEGTKNKYDGLMDEMQDKGLLHLP